MSPAPGIGLSDGTTGCDRRVKVIRYWNEPDRGGHFAAFEQPELFVNEVRAFFRHVR
jgi:epoxide hydrolase